MPIEFTPVPGVVPRLPSRYSALEQTLLAQLAGQAMQVLVALAPPSGADDLRKLTADAYDIAEAMVAEHEKRTC